MNTLIIKKKDREAQQLSESTQKFRRLKRLSHYFLTNKITDEDKQKAIFSLSVAVNVNAP